MLLTKLHIPQVGNNIVHRSSLYEKLNLGLSRKLILVSAPAGFGKTTVVSNWINQNKIPTAWFSLDKGDNDPIEFSSYIISGIQFIQKDFGQNTIKLIKSPNKPSNQSIINLLINEILSIKENFLLVLDDFHLITGNEIFDLLTYFLEHIPDNIHFVVITRSDPPLSLARLRSQNQLIELRASDLSFSANDISILFNKKLKIGLSIEDIYALAKKTEGWIAGLQLTALSMHGREDTSEFIQGLKGDNRYIMDYLIEEVLKIQSDDIKEFLLRTSILGQFSAQLCNYILNKDDSQLIIEMLEKNNMFVIPLDEERNWYRYHHLFADLLKQRLLLAEKSIVNELHNRACGWFEQNGLYELAIGHALETNNYEKSSYLLGKVIEGMWENGQHEAILEYGNIIPDELIKKNPEFCLYYSWILVSAGQIKTAAPFLTSAEQSTCKTIHDKISRGEDASFEKKLLGKIAVAFAYSNSHQEHSAKSFDYCKTAMENLSGEDPLWYSWAWFSYGVSYFAIGDLHESINAFDNALDYAKKSGNIYLISTIIIRMAEIEQQLGRYKSAFKRCNELLAFIKEKGYSKITKSEWMFAALYFIIGVTQYAWADLDHAIDNIQIAYNLCKDAKDSYLKIMILMVSSVILKERGDSEVENRIDELDGLIKQIDVPPYLLSIYIGWKIYMYLQKGQVDEANIFVNDCGLALAQKKDHTNIPAYSSYAKLLITQGKLDEAECLLFEIYDLATQAKNIEQLIQIKVLFVELHQAKGDREKAIFCLLEALELASEEHLLIYFVFSYNDIQNLLEEIFKKQTTNKIKIPQKFIDNIKGFIEKKKALKSNSFGIDISNRELDILKLMNEDISNQEIADKLFISLNTVKTHLKNIYLKLEVDSRAKAVAKAKEMGLI